MNEKPKEPVPVMGMIDKKLAAWLETLEPEERWRVLIGVALGWPELAARNCKNLPEEQ